MEYRSANDFDLEAARLAPDDREDYGEERWVAIGFLDARLHVLAFTSPKSVSAPSVCARQKPMRKSLMQKDKGLGDRDTPIWTKEMQARSISNNELPPALQAKLRPKGRGPQKAMTKTKVSIRLSSDVLEALRATGTGWQSRVDDALRAVVKLANKA